MITWSIVDNALIDRPYWWLIKHEHVKVKLCFALRRIHALHHQVCAVYLTYAVTLFTSHIAGRIKPCYAHISDISARVLTKFVWQTNFHFTNPSSQRKHVGSQPGSLSIYTELLSSIQVYSSEVTQEIYQCCEKTVQFMLLRPRLVYELKWNRENSLMNCFGAKAYSGLVLKRCYSFLLFMQ